MADEVWAATWQRPSQTPEPASWFVDDGFYLMSNGLPEQPRPDGGGRLLVVHADGYRSAMSKHDVADQIGGDDFCQPLSLLDTTGGTTLHALITDGVAVGLGLFVINLDPNEIHFYLADAPEATR